MRVISQGYAKSLVGVIVVQYFYTQKVYTNAY